MEVKGKEIENPFLTASQRFLIGQIEQSETKLPYLENRYDKTWLMSVIVNIIFETSDWLNIYCIQPTRSKRSSYNKRLKSQSYLQ